ncbi:PRC-barrel domain-containing protein [Natranaerobius thermophilus]|uniref:PRC-barrel domain-containing protein n=1 Tax=Natranaerobius thermophilus (strain ATCC BAA-1301 / DSM 18059 / JW/NM-WN-LF) TaxID=457570 RepID=B2A5P6_NATTJ|nr:PRC-barrel domain-containing protein [Natranaerobius thermophilus]ACB83994.1 hypothetical protein Nther_0398 [Natranaerobius thermophilus JW/NM-WN-LF]
MRKNEVVSLPVISIDTGKAFGKVIDIILDVNKKAVTSIMFGEGKFFSNRPSHLVSLDNVQTIGPYAVTIPSEHVILQQGETEWEREHLEKSPIGKKVISDHGEFLGICNDYQFNFPGGQLDSLILSKSKRAEQLFEVPAQQIVTLGTDYIIMSYYEQESTLNTSPVTPQSDIPDYQEPDQLIGKIATQTVQDGQGGVIIFEGEKITPEVVDLATHHNVLKTLAFVANDQQTPPRFAQQASTPGAQYSDARQRYEPDQEWQTRLKEILDQAGGDIEEKLKGFLINKKPAYNVVSQDGHIIKEKGQPIEISDIEQLRDRNDLMRLAASITATEIDDFITSLEQKFQRLMKN